jgi:hypothetical protein
MRIFIQVFFVLISRGEKGCQTIPRSESSFYGVRYVSVCFRSAQGQFLSVTLKLRRQSKVTLSCQIRLSQIKGYTELSNPITNHG